METEVIRGGIKSKIVRIIFIVGIVLTLVFMAIVILSFQKNLRITSLQTVNNIHGMYDSVLTNDTKMLSAALDSFTTNEAYKQLFTKQDRTKLYEAGKELFSNNRSRYGITHFYYIREDGTCFLRMHKPELADDQIKRVTYQRAKETNKTASGIELGQTAFALRVVSPYFYHGTRIGFVEFGEEIDHFDQLVKKETGSDVVVLVSKRFLDEKGYRTTRQNTNKRDDWNDIHDYVVVSETFGDREFFLSKVLKVDELTWISEPAYLGTVKRGDQVFMKGAFPLTDAANKQVGVVMVLSDVTALASHVTNAKSTIFYLLVASLVLLGVSSLIIYRYLKGAIISPMIDLSEQAVQISMGKVDKKLTTARTDEIGMLIRSFDRMRASLQMSLRMLTDKENSKS
ncbi:MAG TPA: cache domain-containing protein [Nitrospirota bacterium]|nr:cache domain-containing protein [Nitrospirota bacterium]